MRRRFFPADAGLWRHRFVQIARELDAGATTRSGIAGLGLRPRPAPGNAGRARGRSRGFATA